MLFLKLRLDIKAILLLPSWPGWEKRGGGREVERRREEIEVKIRNQTRKCENLLRTKFQVTNGMNHLWFIIFFFFCKKGKCEGEGEGWGAKIPSEGKTKIAWKLESWKIIQIISWWNYFHRFWQCKFCESEKERGKI